MGTLPLVDRNHSCDYHWVFLLGVGGDSFADLHARSYSTIVNIL